MAAVQAQASMKKAAARRLMRFRKRGIDRNLQDAVCIGSLHVPGVEEV
jgi:hypothetical protein